MSSPNFLAAIWNSEELKWEIVGYGIEEEEVLRRVPDEAVMFVEASHVNRADIKKRIKNMLIKRKKRKNDKRLSE